MCTQNVGSTFLHPCCCNSKFSAGFMYHSARWHPLRQLALVEFFSSAVLFAIVNAFKPVTQARDVVVALNKILLRAVKHYMRRNCCAHGVARQCSRHTVTYVVVTCSCTVAPPTTINCNLLCQSLAIQKMFNHILQWASNGPIATAFL